MFESQRHLTDSLGGDAVVAAVKSSPPVVVTAAAAAGMPLQSWVAIATLVYVMLQTAYLIWKWARDLRRG
jgi:hypothetical protein